MSNPPNVKSLAQGGVEGAATWVSFSSGAQGDRSKRACTFLSGFGGLARRVIERRRTLAGCGHLY